MGGREGFQIFGSTAELAWLIDRVAAAPQPDRHGLLINGDIIDFLAEEPSVLFDPDGAVAKLDCVWQRFEPVFAALQRLLMTPDRLLIINLGNHDLELALPWVRAHLAQRLTGGDEAATARLLWVTDGTGVRCRVGRASVVCVHGNEVDSWNVTDYERLRRIGRDRQFGLPFEAWTPNAGTQMVIEVMNQIKREYPFVDLLKPETEGVLPILAALKPGVHRKLLDLAGIAGRKAWDLARMRSGFLRYRHPGSLSGHVIPSAPGVRRACTRTKRRGPAERRGAALAPRRDADIACARHAGPATRVLGAAWNFVSGKPKHEVLREALEHLDRDRSFDPAAPDDTFRDLDAMVGADIDLLLAGHTHLERSRRVAAGEGTTSTAAPGHA